MPKNSGTSFHNTLQLNFDQQTELEKRAQSLEVIVLEFFKNNPDKKFTSFQVFNQISTTNPITSVRRAMSNLTKKGMLIKTDDKVVENYGVDNFLWTINPHPPQL